MFGLVVVLIATFAISFASYRLGVGTCDTDNDNLDVDRNTSLVVMALGIMFLLCGVLASMTGSWNPFNAITAPKSTVVI